MSDTTEAMLDALRRADPSLSRFDPMRRILSHDRFLRGHCGWLQLVGNYEHSLDTMLPGYAQHTSAMLLTLSHSAKISAVSAACSSKAACPGSASMTRCAIG